MRPRETQRIVLNLEPAKLGAGSVEASMLCLLTRPCPEVSALVKPKLMRRHLRARAILVFLFVLALIVAILLARRA